MTKDAKKRLEAIESLEDLGAGFTLATHDLEIRGAGELLGTSRAARSTRSASASTWTCWSGRSRPSRPAAVLELDRPLEPGAEIDLGLPALLPADYMPDVHGRLVMYKRIASAADAAGAAGTSGGDDRPLRPLARAGAQPLRHHRIEIGGAAPGHPQDRGGADGGRILFGDQPKVDPLRLIQMMQSRPKEFRMEGGDKLKFFIDLTEPEKRVARVGALIRDLTG
jgi:transcription-repair coupling factor (superfamily II helicase)